MTTSNKGFRHDIEGLRALAVLLVIAFHARILNCQGGFIGVDVFFVLSGYLITGLLVEEVLQTGKLLLVPFYARRIRRLLPASTAMLLGVVIGARFILPPIEQSALSASVQATSAYLSNAYFARISSDYFGPDVVGNALLHTWSLAVEEQFYFVWPLLILFASQVRRSRGAFSLVMLVVGAVSLAASVWLTSNNQPWAFFSMPPRAWEFAVGGAASQISAEWLRNYRWSIRVLGWAGLIVVVASGFWLSPIGFPGIKAVLPVLGTAAVLICGAIELRGGPMVILSAKPLQYVGQRSYALYLWHWPLLVYASVLSEPSSFLLRLACVGAAFVLAELTKLAIENPIRFNPYLRSQSMLCVSTSVLVMFAGVAGGAVWNRWAMHTADYATYGKAMFDLPEDSRLGCENAFGESVPRECDFGSATPSKTIVLFGDSHAEQWLPAFHEIADRKNWKIALFVKSSCPALAISISAAQAAGEDVWCRKWRELAIERIRQLHPAAVVLSNATEYKEINRPQVFQSRDEWRAGARKTFSAFKKDEFPLVFIRDTPWARYDVTRCLARAAWNKNNHPCASLVRRAALNDDVYRAEIGGSEGVRPVSFIDLSDVICGPTSCNLTQGDTIIYRDSSHLTATYLRSLSNNLYDQLVRAVPALAR